MISFEHLRDCARYVLAELPTRPRTTVPGVVLRLLEIVRQRFNLPRPKDDP